MWTKLLSLLLIAYLFRRGVNPPNVANDQSDAIKKEGAFFDNVVIGWGPSLSTLGCWSLIAVYIVIMLLQESGTEPPWCAKLGCIRFSSWSVTDLVGLACLISGSLLRIWCYHTLGRFFTFSVAIRKDHRIIDVGPYALVRHPSYTGILLMAVGSYFLIMVGLFSCISAFSFQNSSGIFFATLVIMIVTAIRKRVQTEEAEMHAKFGSAWETYTRKTKRFVPFVL